MEPHEQIPHDYRGNIVEEKMIRDAAIEQARKEFHGQQPNSGVFMQRVNEIIATMSNPNSYKGKT